MKILLLPLLFLGQSGPGEEALEQTLMELSEAERPLTYEDLFIGYARDTQVGRAADLWQEGLAGIDSIRATAGQLLRQPVVRSLEKQRQPLEEFLNTHSARLATLYRAADHAAIPRLHAVLGTDSISAVVRDLETAALFFLLDARLKAMHRNRTLTLAALEGALQVVRILEEDSLTVSHITRCNIILEVLGQIPEFLREISFSGEELEQIEELLSRVSFRRSYLQSLEGERVFWIDRYRSGRNPHAGTDVFAEGTNAAVEVLGSMLEQGEAPWPQLRLHLFSSLAKLPQAEERPGNGVFHAAIMTDSSRAVPVRATLDSESLPVSGRTIALAGLAPMAGVMSHTLYTLTMLRSAKLTLALEKYRRAKSSLPKNLNQLIPHYLEQIPRDPITGGQISYKVEFKKDSYSLFSWGEDGIDNGGVEVKSRRGPDWVYRVRIK